MLSLQIKRSAVLQVSIRIVGWDGLVVGQEELVLVTGIFGVTQMEDLSCGKNKLVGK